MFQESYNWSFNTLASTGCRRQSLGDDARTLAGGSPGQGRSGAQLGEGCRVEGVDAGAQGRNPGLPGGGIAAPASIMWGRVYPGEKPLEVGDSLLPPAQQCIGKARGIAGKALWLDGCRSFAEWQRLLRVARQGQLQAEGGVVLRQTRLQHLRAA